MMHSVYVDSLASQGLVGRVQFDRPFYSVMLETNKMASEIKGVAAERVWLHSKKTQVRFLAHT